MTLLLASSLSRAVGGRIGLSESEVIEFLAAPGRKPDEFLQALQRLREQAWYLHREDHHFRETVTETSRIKQMLFDGFARCLYPLQKFDSDSERRFANILERDATKWSKPAKGQFQIYYKLGTEQPEYIPDFVAETDATIFMVETKARPEINTQEVQAKAAAAMRWCKCASDHAAAVGTKPWKYLLVPHAEVNEARRLEDFLRFEVQA